MSPRILVRLRTLATSEGGRATPFVTGYRPTFDAGAIWQGRPMFTTGTIEIAGGRLAPGMEAEATVVPMSPEYWDHLRPGETMRVMEGSRLVGSATVIERSWPAALGPEITRFVRAAHELCAFIEAALPRSVEDRIATARTTLLALYAAAVGLPRREGPTRATQPPAFPTDAAPDFEQFDIYREVFDPYVDAPPVAGSLSEDLREVYLDVRRGLWQWDQGSNDEAIWSWRFSFDAHWGDHAIDALRALHRACGAAPAA